MASESQSTVAMGTTRQVKAWVGRLKMAGCTTDYNTFHGTAEAKDGDAVVFRALQKGLGGPWIIRFINGGRINWEMPDPVTTKKHEGSDVPRRDA